MGIFGNSDEEYWRASAIKSQAARDSEARIAEAKYGRKYDMQPEITLYNYSPIPTMPQWIVRKSDTGEGMLMLEKGNWFLAGNSDVPAEFMKKQRVTFIWIGRPGCSGVMFQNPNHTVVWEEDEND